MHPTRQWAWRRRRQLAAAQHQRAADRERVLLNIRPKRVTATGERPLQALRACGIQYIEVRCLDINPFLPLGIDLNEARFLDAFFCSARWPTALAWPMASAARPPTTSSRWSARADAPLQLQHCGEAVPLGEWAGQLLDEIAEVAALLDRSHGDSRHAEALAEQRAKVADSSLTPSARVLEQLRTNGESFSQFAMRQTLAHADFRSQAPSANELQQFETAARQSLERQAAMEAADEPDFDSFVADYQRSLTPNRPAGATPASRLQSGFSKIFEFRWKLYSEARAAGRRSTLMGSKPRSWNQCAVRVVSTISFFSPSARARSSMRSSNSSPRPP